MERSEALRLIAEAAVASERAKGCPAELTTAQALLESGWLARALGNNCFGIKRAKRHAQWQTFKTWEVEDGKRIEKYLQFAKYDSLADCFADHARLITTGAPYADAWAYYEEHGNLDELIRGVARKYATDPEYGRKIATLAVRDDVRAALIEARKA